MVDGGEESAGFLSGWAEALLGKEGQRHVLDEADAGELAALVNRALVEQARRHGVDLS
jgi:hypothetical protein